MPRPTVTLEAELARQRPELADPAAAIVAGLVLVEGRFVQNPKSRVPRGCSLVVRDDAPLRGSAKLAAALAAFGLRVEGRIALDAGAAAGGFTRVLLDAGARRVYAVDVGHGQLVGSLRQDPRVVNLEGTNLGVLTPELVPDEVDVVSLDLSYLSLAEGVAQLDRIVLAPDADLIALVKPMFELHLDHAPTDDASLADAVERASEAITGAGWQVVDTMRSPVTGAKGAVEGLLHAKRGELPPTPR